MLPTGGTRLQHGLHHHALTRIVIGRDDDVLCAAVQQRAQGGRQRAQRHRDAVDVNMAVGIDRQRHRRVAGQPRCLALRQVDLERVEALHRQRRQHEGRQQEKHHVDHRDDFNPAFALYARLTQLHGCAPGRASAGRAGYGRSGACRGVPFRPWSALAGAKNN